MEPAVDPWSGDIGAFAVNTLQRPGLYQLRDGLAYGHSTDAEAIDECSLGGYGITRTKFAVDQIFENSTHLGVLCGRCIQRAALESIAAWAHAGGPPNHNHS